MVDVVIEKEKILQLHEVRKEADFGNLMQQPNRRHIWSPALDCVQHDLPIKGRRTSMCIAFQQRVIGSLGTLAFPEMNKQTVRRTLPNISKMYHSLEVITVQLSNSEQPH